jgi:LysM repeat protein
MKVAELKELNNLSGDFINEGAQLNVYKSGTKSDVLAKNNPAAARKYVLDSDGLYTIQPGDSVDRIAHNFAVTRSSLMEANGIDDPLRLQIGKKLIIPSGNSKANPVSSSPRNAIQAGRASGPTRESVNEGGRGAQSAPADSDDFFETFDSIKVFEIDN